MAEKAPSPAWQVTLVSNRFLWVKEPLRPADMSDKLRAVMLSRRNLIEDADYHKVVPNRYVVELNQEVYAGLYRPIEARVLQQWRERLLEDLELANSRLGRSEYHFAGRVEIQLRPATDLPPSAARIYCQVGRDQPATGFTPPPIPAEQRLPAYLELVPDGRRFPLRRGVVTLGRDGANDVVLDSPLVKERRLVSARHAYLRCEPGRCLLFDGSPNGRPSTNGTFVNGERVQPAGQPLSDGDLIQLAALAGSPPRPDTPGAAVLRFHAAAAGKQTPA